MRYLHLLVGLVIAALPLSAQAQVRIWSGAGGDPNWSTGANWLGGVPPANPGTAGVQFQAATGTITSVVDAPWQISGLLLELPVRTITGQTITFTSSPVISISGTGHSIANNLVLNQTLLAQIIGDISLPGSVTGVGGLTKSDPGTLTLAGPGFYTGTTTISGGRLAFTGPPTIITVVNNSELELAAPGGVAITNPVTGTGSVFVTAGSAAGTLNHSGPTTIGPATMFGGTIDNGALLTLDGTMNTGGATVGALAGNGQLNINSGLFTVGSNGASTLFTGNVTNAGDLTKVGTGTLTLAGSVNTGVITVSQGTLALGDGASGPNTVITMVNNANVLLAVPLIAGGTAFTNPVTGTGNVAVTNTGFAVGTFNHAGTTTVLALSRLDGAINNNALFVLDGEFNTGGTAVGSLAGAATGTLNVNSGTFGVGGDNTSTVYSGALAGAGDFVKVGTGELVLAGTGFVTGTTTIAGGTLTYGNGVTGPATVISLVDNGLLRINVGTGNTIAITSPVTGLGSVHVQSGMTFSGGWNHAGTTTVDAGARLDGSINTPGALTLNGIIHTGTATVGSLAGAVTGTFNLNTPLDGLTVGSDNSSTTFGGTIASVGQLVKVGTGTLTLTGSNTYSGTTTVTGGALIINGTHLSSTTTVNAPALLGGVGNLNFALIVNAGATLAPGSGGAGQLLTGALTLSGTLQQQILGAGSFDSVRSSGVTLNNAALTLSGPYVPVSGDTFMIIQNDGVAPVVGTFAGLPEGATFTFNSRILRISYVGGTGNDVVLSVAQFTVTPSAGANGTIAPTAPVSVSAGATTTFTVTPSSGYTAAVGGTCGGNLVGMTFTTNAITANCTVVASFTLNSYTVTSSAGANGTIAPLGAVPVNHGSTTVFTVTPDATYSASIGGTCGGNLVGNTYTTNPITGPCTVIASFSQVTFTVTPSAGANGTITPSTPQTVVQNGTTTFTLAPSAGYTAAVGGTCGGSLSGNVYTTNAITANCTVAATFTQNTFTVTPSAGANGTISPSTPQTVAQGATTTFIVTPSAFYTATVGGTCGGNLVGTTYTTNAITANCTVVATFTSGATTTFSGPTATGTGTATAVVTGGGATCGFGVAQFIPVSGHAASPPAGSAPASIAFPHGLFNFTLTGCVPGSVTTLTITYPSALPAGSSYWKYGPEPSSPAPHWYILPATLAGATATFSITDGQLGDDDLAANGTIVDQGGPGVPPAGGGAQQTPTLSEWMLAVLACLMLLMGAASTRKARARR